MVEISPFPYVDLTSPEHDEDYAFPTYSAIIAYTQKQILKRIEEIKDRAVDKIGVLSLAPLFSLIIVTSLIYEKNIPDGEEDKIEVKRELETQINNLLTINSERSPYSKN